jgi:hypothetical protein
MSSRKRRKAFSLPKLLSLAGGIVGLIAAVLAFLPASRSWAMLPACGALVSSLIGLGLSLTIARPSLLAFASAGVAVLAVGVGAVQRTMHHEQKPPSRTSPVYESQYQPKAKTSRKSSSPVQVQSFREFPTLDPTKSLIHDSIGEYFANKYGGPLLDAADHPDAVAALDERGITLAFATTDTSNGLHRPVVEALFAGVKCNDELMRELGPHLSRLPNLRRLNLATGSVTAAGLRLITAADELRDVVLPIGSDEIAIELIRFPKLRSVQFMARGTLTDKGVLLIAGMPGLEVFDAGSTVEVSDEITDNSFEHFAELPRLRELLLPYAALTGRGLHRLQSTENLALLDLSFTNVNDDALRVMGAMPALQKLKLSGTQIKGDSLRVLEFCPKLEELSLAEMPRLEAKHLLHLAKVQGLRRLMLYATPLTDAVIEDLAQLGQLELLDVSGCGLSERALTVLRKSMPKCTIDATDVVRKKPARAKAKGSANS